MFRVHYCSPEGHEYICDCDFTSMRDARGYAALLMDTGRVFRAWVEDCN